MKKFVFTANKKIRLLKFLSQNLPSYRYADFVFALQKKDILVNSIRVKNDDYIGDGDVIEIYLKDAVFSVKVEYEDSNVIIFNKPKKIEVCDGDYNIKDEYKKIENKDIFPIHRLDAGTSGLVVFAKNKNAEKILIDAFKKHSVEKYYYAVVSGKPKNNDMLKGYLVKDSNLAKVKIFDTEQSNSSYVELKYELLNQKDELSLLDVMIVAGKTHQIRAQLSYAGLPIVGDDKYGKGEINKKYKYRFQLLQAYKIKFNLSSLCELSYLNDLDFSIDCEFKNLFD